MANKKKNDILEEQRRAREEFLKLKKMQHGEMDAGPKPSEVAIVPKTFKEKWDNYWFQYKWHTIGITLAAATLIFLVAQCASRPKYDFNVIYFTYTPVMDSQIESVAEYFEKYAKDLNGDGEVKVQVMNCSFSNDSSDMQYKSVQLQKIQAYIAGEDKAMLYITDEESMEYFDNISSDGGMFSGEPLKLPEEFYTATAVDGVASLPEGLQISCRKTNGTVLEKNATAKAVAEESERILEILKTK